MLMFGKRGSGRLRLRGGLGGEWKGGGHRAEVEKG